MVVYPRTTNDVRKVARFSWQLAERGHIMPMTARGNGTDLTGAALGTGVILSLPTHMNKILELDTKQRLVRVQPGVNFKSLQETLHTHGLFLPPAPESYEYSTIGGAIANNASGIRSYKYGDMAAWIDRLEVVLANGELIQTGPLGKRELNKKLGLPTLEGELYRAVDAILSDNTETITEYSKAINAASDNVGFRFESLVHKNGDLDLTQLFVGSQGTLGVITEAILKVAPYTPASTLVVAAFANMDDALEVAGMIARLQPSALELVDAGLLEFVRKHNSVELPVELLVDGKPATTLFIEAQNLPDRALGKFTKQVIKAVSRYTDSYLSATDFEEREKLWSYRYVTAPFMGFDVGGKIATPIIQNVGVPQAALHQFMEDAKALCRKHHVEAAIWAHVQSGEVIAMPLIDLSKLGDRQQVFKLMDEYFRLVIKLGGSIAPIGGEGRLRAPFAKLQSGGDLFALYEQLKGAADPHRTLNPGVKLGVEPKELVNLLRKDYTLQAFADYLPRM
jgi:FAD/FMN-containing dehydrogenase